MNKKINIVFIITILLQVVSCQDFNDEKSVFLKNSKSLDLFANIKAKIWNPNKDDILFINEMLQKAADENVFASLGDKKLTNYYKQMIPYIDEHGDRIVLVNAFCEIPKIPTSENSGMDDWVDYDWKENLVQVFDGGDCYWQIKLNIDKRIYFDFEVNGTA